MGKKKKGPSCGRRGAEPMAGVVPTDRGVAVRGVSGEVWVLALPSGGRALLAVSAILPLPAGAPLPAKTEALYREIGSLTRQGFPDDPVRLFQESICHVAMRQALGEAAPVDVEAVLADVARLLGKLPAGERAAHLAAIAAACGFTAGDAFAFLDALPEAAQGER